jgi:hypothetical protein
MRASDGTGADFSSSAGLEPQPNNRATIVLIRNRITTGNLFCIEILLSARFSLPPHPTYGGRERGDSVME